MNTHILRSTTAIFDLLNNDLDQFSDFKVQYITNNIVGRQENGSDDEEMHRVVNAFDVVERLWNTVDKLCAEELEKNQRDIRIAMLNHMLVVVTYLKDNFNIIIDIMQNVEDRMRCHQKL
jgi:flagellar biosynthesis regulator FlaF